MVIACQLVITANEYNLSIVMCFGYILSLFQTITQTLLQINTLNGFVSILL